MMMEKEVCLLEFSKMTPERYKKLTADWEQTDEQKETKKLIINLLEKNDPTFLDHSAVYMEKYYDNIIALMEKPYTQAYTEIGVEGEKAPEDIRNGKDEAALAAVFCPALAKCYSHGIRWKTTYDAMLTAMDVYIFAAKNGKLPTELPKSTCIDHFSGKPFIYEVTKDGFTLKCQQEDLSEKITPEFSYKLPK